MYRYASENGFQVSVLFCNYENSLYFLVIPCSTWAHVFRNKQKYSSKNKI